MAFELNEAKRFEQSHQMKWAALLKDLKKSSRENRNCEEYEQSSKDGKHKPADHNQKIVAKSESARPYRKCRQYKVSDRHISFVYVSPKMVPYEKGNFKKNKVKHSGGKMVRNKRLKFSRNTDFEVPLKTEVLNYEKNNKQRKTKKPKNDIRSTLSSKKSPKVNIPPIQMVSENDSFNNDNRNKSLPSIVSSGYGSDTTSRRSSCSTSAFYLESETNAFMQNAISKMMLCVCNTKEDKNIIDLQKLNHLECDHIAKGVEYYIRSYLRIRDYYIDESLMRKLIYLVEHVGKSSVRNTILGMRILESLNDMTNVWYSRLCDRFRAQSSELLGLMQLTSKAGSCDMQTVTVHPLTENPTEAWKEIGKEQKVLKVNVKLPTKPPSDKQVRFVCMSDTHSLVHNIKFDIPDGDVFIHAGDFSKCGHVDEVKEFNRWLGALPHKHKIVICGNHELSFDPKFVSIFKKKFEPSSRHTGILTNRKNMKTYGEGEDELEEAISTLNIREYLDNCIYLEDAPVELYGIKIYGTPWQPEFGNWGFNLKRGTEILRKWELIPDDTDILITHSPPLGHGDLVCSGVRAGCVELLSTVQQRVKPKYHVFGHIHEGYGVSSDGKIIYINASTCDINYMPNNLPIVFDFTIPPGFTKT